MIMPHGKTIGKAIGKWGLNGILWDIPSGNLTSNYGNSTFLMGISTINGPFSIAMLNYWRVAMNGIFQLKIVMDRFTDRLTISSHGVFPVR